MDDYSVEDSLRAWETNADFWDESMGDASNRFHREVVRPRAVSYTHLTLPTNLWV